MKRAAICGGTKVPECPASIDPAAEDEDEDATPRIFAAAGNGTGDTEEDEGEDEEEDAEAIGQQPSELLADLLQELKPYLKDRMGNGGYELN